MVIFCIFCRYPLREIATSPLMVPFSNNNIELMVKREK